MRKLVKFASAAAILAAVLVVLQPNSSIVFADEPLGARIAEEARALIGTAPYATNPADCDQNPCNGWLVCTDVVAVATDRAGVPISEDYCACTKMRRAEEQQSFFEGSEVAGANNSLKRHFEASGSANPPVVGNILLFGDHVAVVVDVQPAREGKLNLTTVETRGGNAESNIGTRDYYVVLRSGGWYFADGHRYSLIKGWGVIDEAASEGSTTVIGEVRAVVETVDKTVGKVEQTVETAERVVRVAGWLRENSQLVVVAGLVFVIFFVLIFLDNLMMRSGRKVSAKRWARGLWRLGWLLLIAALVRHDEILKHASLIVLGLGAYYKVSAWWDKKRRDRGWVRALPVAVSYVGEFFLISLALAYLLGIIFGLTGVVGVVGPSSTPESAVAVRKSGPSPLGEVRFAGVYGWLGSGGWGSLSEVNTAEQAVAKAEKYAQWVGGWTTDEVIPVVNLVLRNQKDKVIQSVIDLCAERSCVVMLDLSPKEDCKALIEKWAPKGAHIWFDLDVEHAGSAIQSSVLNKLTAIYFDIRREAGFESSGVFGFYDFRSDPWVTESVPGGERFPIRWTYANGIVVPIYDGHCQGEPCRTSKWGATERMIVNYFDAPAYGAMEFLTRFGCGSKYGDCGFTAQEYFEEFQPLIFLAQ